MQFGIAKSFERALKPFFTNSDDSFAQIQTTLMKIGSNYDSNGLNFEKINDFYSFRVNRDIRIIASLCQNQITMVYVDHHEKAYEWCQRNKPVYAKEKYVGYVEQRNVGELNSVSSPDTARSGKYDYLLNDGFSRDFVSYINTLSEDQLLSFIQYISPEYQELVLYGDDSNISKTSSSDVFITTDDASLRFALEKPFDYWRVFLHPRQEYIKTYPLSKNLIIKGGPGTGKTVALVHRFKRALASSNPGGKMPVFLCYNDFTRNILKEMLHALNINNDNLLVTFDDARLDFNGKKLQEFLNSFSHIFIDEAQDMPLYFGGRFLFLLQEGKTLPNFTFSFDLNQAICGTNGEFEKRLEKQCDVINLSYCYRSTKQIIEVALQELKKDKSFVSPKNFQEESLIAASSDEITTTIECPLSGPDVQKFSFSTDEEAVVFIQQKIGKMALPLNEWAIIVVNRSLFDLPVSYSNFKNLFSPEEVKGREFKGGFVVFGEQQQVMRTHLAFRKAVLSKYVSISRFRDFVYLIAIKKEE